MLGLRNSVLLLVSNMILDYTNLIAKLKILKYRLEVLW